MYPNAVLYSSVIGNVYNDIECCVAKRYSFRVSGLAARRVRDWRIRIINMRTYPTSVRGHLLCNRMRQTILWFLNWRNFRICIWLLLDKWNLIFIDTHSYKSQLAHAYSTNAKSIENYYIFTFYLFRFDMIIVCHEVKLIIVISRSIN